MNENKITSELITRIHFLKNQYLADFIKDANLSLCTLQLSNFLPNVSEILSKCKNGEMTLKEAQIQIEQLSDLDAFTKNQNQEQISLAKNDTFERSYPIC
jgi:hypothetical protein